MRSRLLKIHIRIFSSVLFLILFLPWAQAFDLNLDKAEGHVEFLAIGRPSAIRIKGKGNKLRGKLKIQEKEIQGNIAFDLRTLDTGINLRNRHMKEKYLEVQKYPEASFSFLKMKLPHDFFTKEEFSQDDVPFDGTLTLHGVKQSISGTLDIDKRKNELESEAEFKIKLKDFNIETPSFKGISVTEDVNVKVSTLFSN